MRSRWPWIDGSTVFWVFILGVTWAGTAIVSCLRQDWVTGVIQLLTGVILVASTLRSRLAIYRAQEARATFEEATRRANQALWVCLTIMAYSAREDAPGPKDIERHSLN